VDEARLNQLLEQVIGDMGGALTSALVRIGDELGLYRALDAAGPCTSAELAAHTGTAERYVREWLNNQAAAGYVSYAGGQRYSLSPEQAELFVNEDSPACVLGGFEGMHAATLAREKVAAAFRTGEGVGWHEHHADLFEGTERFFRPGYAANLTEAWIPALGGVADRLREGGRVADVGCGYGASTILMALAYPASRFWGFDYHEPSVQVAVKRAADAGVGDRVKFEVASAQDYPGTGFDLVCHFDCLHDMGDPVGAARHARESLAQDGTWMLVEPFAGDDVADNLNPIGKVFYGVSALVCTPASLSQQPRYGLGAQAGEARLRHVAEQAGFSRFRRATETPFNIVLEGKP
jgi:SAM-dependent methyltransferase